MKNIGQKMHSIESLPLGRIVITPPAEAAVPLEEVMRAVSRHQLFDWGDVPQEDWENNDSAVENQGRVLSNYQAKSGDRFWIITKWDRSNTTILLPSDYLEDSMNEKKMYVGLNVDRYTDGCDEVWGVFEPESATALIEFRFWDDGDGVERKRMEEKARLFAAAPRMLYALQVVEKWLTKSASSHSEVEYMPETVRAAIESATG